MASQRTKRQREFADKQSARLSRVRRNRFRKRGSTDESGTDDPGFGQASPAMPDSNAGEESSEG